MQILYVFVLRTRKPTALQANVLDSPVGNTNIYKICKLCLELYFPFFTTFRHQT